MFVREYNCESVVQCFVHLSTYSIYRFHSPVLSLRNIPLKILVLTLEILASIASGA